MRTLAYKDDNIKLEFEVWEKVLVLHCDVTNWQPSVLRRSKEIFNNFKNEAKEAGYEGLVTFTPNPKFAKLFGGEYVQDLPNHENVEVIRWVLS